MLPLVLLGFPERHASLTMVLPFWSVQWSNTSVDSAGRVTVPSLIDSLLEIPTEAVPVVPGEMVLDP